MNRNMQVGDLRKEIIGQTVTEINEKEKTITLANGKRLRFIDQEACCAWFSAELKAGNLTDNAVTRLDITDRREDKELFDSQEDYTIHILAANKKIADLTITGDETSGYYCHSIALEVEEI